MLDDLKTTVNKTTEHLNTLNSTKSRDVQFLSPANSTTVVEERTSSPIVCVVHISSIQSAIDFALISV